jgi:hypothetical protein
MTRYSNAFDDGPGDAAARCEAHASLWLTERLRLDAEENGRKARVTQFARADGWNSAKVRAFLFSLAECGVVSDAAQAAGISRAAAYKLRDRGPAFRLAWDAALRIARRRLTDELMSRAMRGCVELIYRDGKLWEERHRHDNRLGLALLTRLDRLARRDDRETGHTRASARGSTNSSISSPPAAKGPRPFSPRRAGAASRMAGSRGSPSRSPPSRRDPPHAPKPPIPTKTACPERPSTCVNFVYLAFAASRRQGVSRA